MVFVSRRGDGFIIGFGVYIRWLKLKTTFRWPYFKNVPLTKEDENNPINTIYPWNNMTTKMDTTPYKGYPNDIHFPSWMENFAEAINFPSPLWCVLHVFPSMKKDTIQNKRICKFIWCHRPQWRSFPETSNLIYNPSPSFRHVSRWRVNFIIKGWGVMVGCGFESSMRFCALKSTSKLYLRQGCACDDVSWRRI